jgi:septation ring formation regulator EzrA
LEQTIANLEKQLDENEELARKGSSRWKNALEEEIQELTALLEEEVKDRVKLEKDKKALEEELHQVEQENDKEVLALKEEIKKVHFYFFLYLTSHLERQNNC